MAQAIRGIGGPTREAGTSTMPFLPTGDQFLCSSCVQRLDIGGGRMRCSAQVFLARNVSIIGLEFLAVT